MCFINACLAFTRKRYEKFPPLGGVGNGLCGIDPKTPLSLIENKAAVGDIESIMRSPRHDSDHIVFIQVSINI
jgi:hypothetical protein